MEEDCNSWHFFWPGQEFYWPGIKDFYWPLSRERRDLLTNERLLRLCEREEWKVWGHMLEDVSLHSLSSTSLCSTSIKQRNHYNTTTAQQHTKLLSYHVPTFNFLSYCTSILNKITPNQYSNKYWYFELKFPFILLYREQSFTFIYKLFNKQLFNTLL